MRLAGIIAAGCAVLGLWTGMAQAAPDIVGFDDLVLDAQYAPNKANGDTPEPAISIGGTKFSRATRSVTLKFGGVTLDADVSIRTYQGQIQGVVVKPVVPPAMDVQDVARFVDAFADSASQKYEGCQVLLDKFGERAGMLALKDPEGDGLSIIWDVADVSIIYQTAFMGEANKRENGEIENATPETPSRVH
jgi:hypothetical protein